MSTLPTFIVDWPPAPTVTNAVPRLWKWRNPANEWPELSSPETSQSSKSNSQYHPHPQPPATPLSSPIPVHSPIPLTYAEATKTPIIRRSPSPWPHAPPPSDKDDCWTPPPPTSDQTPFARTIWCPGCADVIVPIWIPWDGRWLCDECLTTGMVDALEDLHTRD